MNSSDLEPNNSMQMPLLMLNVFQLIELNKFPGELRFIIFSYLLIFKFSIFKYKIHAIILEYYL